jgi:hypothetical protein
MHASASERARCRRVVWRGPPDGRAAGRGHRSRRRRPARRGVSPGRSEPSTWGSRVRSLPTRRTRLRACRASHTSRSQRLYRTRGRRPGPPVHAARAARAPTIGDCATRSRNGAPPRPRTPWAPRPLPSSGRRRAPAVCGPQSASGQTRCPPTAEPTTPKDPYD